MHVVDTFHDGVHEVLDLSSCHCVFVGLDDIHQILAAVFHDEVEAGKVLWVRRSHDVLKFHNVLMTSEDSHELHLSQESMGIDVTLKDVLD